MKRLIDLGFKTQVIVDIFEKTIEIVPNISVLIKVSPRFNEIFIYKIINNPLIPLDNIFNPRRKCIYNSVWKDYDSFKILYDKVIKLTKNIPLLLSI